MPVTGHLATSAGAGGRRSTSALGAEALRAVRGVSNTLLDLAVALRRLSAAGSLSPADRHLLDELSRRAGVASDALVGCLLASPHDRATGNDPETRDPRDVVGGCADDIREIAGTLEAVVGDLGGYRSNAHRLARRYAELVSPLDTVSGRHGEGSAVSAAGREAVYGDRSHDASPATDAAGGDRARDVR